VAKKRKTPRSKEAVLADVNKVVRLVRDDHLTLRAALDKVGLELLSDHAAHCVAGGGAAEREELTEELMAAVRRMLRRG